MIFSPPHLHDGSRWAGLRVGLLGGSFNPPHAGHVHASLIALKSLQLDVIWWLVTPQNPLKNKSVASFENRFQACHEFITDPRIVVSDLEQHFDTNLTWQTIRYLKDYFPRTEFAWLTGMDNALTMHRWHNWKDILANVSTAHVARPPAWSIIENCPLKLLDGQNHHYIEKSAKVRLEPRHTYWILQKKLMAISSTKIRNNKNISNG